MNPIGFWPVALLFLDVLPLPRKLRLFATSNFDTRESAPPPKRRTITDEGIKEVYWLAVEVHAAGQRHIPIEIFPLELTEDGFESLAKSHVNQPELLAFWSNLREGFDLFEKNHRALKVTVAGDGRYEFNQERSPAESR